MCWKKITCTTGEKIHNHENANLMDLRCVSTAGYFQMCFHCESINLNEKAAEQLLFVITLKQNWSENRVPPDGSILGNICSNKRNNLQGFLSLCSKT